jgi:Na+/proline symporter
MEDGEGIVRHRMDAFQTYFAIIKGYTTMSLFTLPIGFKEGGWLFSPLVLVFSCFIETTSAIKLCQAAYKTKIYSYPDLVEYSYGKGIRNFF